MACKIRCPKCKMMLKEEGDYIIYESIELGKSNKMIRCFSCSSSSDIGEVHKAAFDIISGKIKDIIYAGPDYLDDLNKLLHYVEEVKKVFDDE